MARMLVFATSLSPERMRLLDQKYAAVPLQIRMVVYDLFRDQADYVEPVLRQYKSHPESFGDVQNIQEIKKALEAWKGRANWWEKAKKVRDPRITQHPEWNPTHRWEFSKYGPGQLDAMQRRFPKPIKPRELIMSHEPPVKLLAREERPDGVWEVVEIDGTGQAKAEYKAQIKDFAIKTEQFFDQVGISGSNAIRVWFDSLYLDIKPYYAKFSEGYSVYDTEISVNEVIQQDVVMPAKKAGWIVQTLPITSSIQAFNYRMFAPALRKYIQAICRYGEGTKWCTTQPSDAVSYLEAGPLVITLHDGHPVSQAWYSVDNREDHVAIMNRDDKEEQDPRVLGLVRQHAGIKLVNWKAVKQVLSDMFDNFSKIDFSRLIPDYLDIREFSKLVGTDDPLEMLSKTHTLATRVDARFTPECLAIISKYIELQNLMKFAPEGLDNVIQDILEDKSPQGSSDEEIGIALEWIEAQRQDLDSIIGSWLETLEEITDAKDQAHQNLSDLWEMCTDKEFDNLVKLAGSVEDQDRTGFFTGLGDKIQNAAFPA